MTSFEQLEMVEFGSEVLAHNIGEDKDQSLMCFQVVEAAKRELGLMLINFYIGQQSIAPVRKRLEWNWLKAHPSQR